VTAELTTRLRAALTQNSAPIIITGGSGWLGQATLHLLDSLHALDRVRVYGSQARMLLLRSGAKIACDELPALTRYDGPPPLLLHYACLTKDRLAGMGEDMFAAGNTKIRETIAGLIERRGVSGMFLPSSGAAYAPGPYGEAKRLDEARFSEAKIPRLVIARIFNLAGPFINKTETYAIADFCSRLIAGEDIEIRARSKVIRSYVHIEDLLLLALGLLVLGPEKKQKFDTAGEVEVEVGQLARRAASLLRPEARILRPPPDGSPDDIYTGNPAAMRAAAAGLGVPLRDLDTQIKDIAHYLRG